MFKPISYFKIHLLSGVSRGRPIFVNQRNGEIIWVKTDKKIFPAFEREINSLIEQYSSAVNFDKENSTLMPKPNIDDVHAVNTINAAFLLQSLLDTFNGDNNTNTLNWSLQIQHYVGLIQPGIGLAEDTVNLAKLVMMLGKFEYKPLTQAINALNKILPHGSLAHAPGAIGVLLDVVNITGIIGQIVNSTNSIEQNTAIANLTMAGISSGVNLTTLLASTAVAEFLGPLAIPLAGVAIGIPEVVSSFSQVAESCKAAVTEYDRVLEGIQTPDRLLNISKDNKKPVWSFNLSAIIHTIDFNNNSVQYGNVTTIGSKGGSLHTVTAGLDHFFSGPSPDYSLRLDVYAGLGLNNKTQIIKDMINASIFCLPLGVDTHYNFNYDVFSFHRGMKAIACEKLRAFYGMQFVWKFWQIVTNDYAICNLRPTYAPTTVKVKLNSKNRTLVIPTNWSDEQRKNLAYEISGGGGMYKVILPARPVRIDFVTSQSSDELWLLDITSILAKSETVYGKTITEPLVLSKLNNIKISINGFTIDKYSVRFMDIPSKPLFLLVDLNVQETSLVAEIDFASGTHSVSLLWNDTPQNFDPAKVVMKTINTLINYGWTEKIPLTIKNDLSITAIVELKDKCILHANKNGLFITRPISESFPATETQRLIDVTNIENNYLSLGSSGELIYSLSSNDIHSKCIIKIPTIFNLNIILINATQKYNKNNKEAIAKIKGYLGVDYSSFIKLNFPSLMETRLSSVTFAPDFIFSLSREKDFNYMMSFNEKKQLHLQSATWKTPEADFIFDGRMILLNTSDSSTTLTPSIYDIELSAWTDFEIPLYINPGSTLRHLEINENIWRVINISVILGTINNGMTIKLSGLTSKSPMERDGVDLIIRTSDRHVIKIINAFGGEGGIVFDDIALDIEGIGKLLLGIEDHTEAFLIKNEIENHFTIEHVKSFFRNGSQIYFTGDSGVNYILYGDGKVVSDNTEIVIDTNILTIPSGLNALFLLKNIIAGRRVFETEEVDELMIIFDKEIKLKGKEAIDFLAECNEGMATLMSFKLVMNNLLDPSDIDTFNYYTKVFDLYIRKGVYS
ncbi:TcdA/TcdB pore-forming domain-containing protein [Enterobacter asburiae]|uniref:TcdA/TcdB pore-forming domain-containing protein n=1 Tax=Enterobacter asburiae TaxID=61645 RepID=UPI002878AFA3|nr:TcdA/TcdB pore-forming domain-containing protein [Enterobacter asburiae]MDS1916431.1 TcdA/TcdB pore-forming domain-containing protein [Enterobacter asburiae]